MAQYPFSPALLDALPEELAELFRALELTLLDDICSRLNLRDELNEATVQAIKALRSHGIDMADIEKAIQQTANVSEKKLKTLLQDVVDRNRSYYTELVGLAKVTAPDTMVDQAAVDAITDQAFEDFRNITRSLGFLVDAGRTKLAPAKAYQWALDNAAMQIQSGAVNYNQAIRSSVRQLAQSGLKTVMYESGHTDQVDVAARRAVMTGVNQICDQYSEQAAEYLDTRYFEVTAHSGARDKPGPSPWSSHKDWQGQVYYYSEHGEPDPAEEYADLVETTGYGYVDGLLGANCRHHKHVFIPGVMERTYTDKQLRHIDDGLGCTFDGKKYTAYEATQMQRRIERSIRKLKREKAAYDAAGLTEDAQAAGIRLKRLNAKYKEFSKAAGLPEQRERMRVDYVDEASLEKAGKAGAPASVSGGYKDVTEQWYAEATPNSHVVQDLHEYTVNGVTYKVGGRAVVLDYSPHEKEIAELLEKEFGGELYMVPRVNNPQSVRTPDYMLRGIGYDLKTLGADAGTNTLFNRVKKADGQAKNFIIDVTNTELDEDTILAQVKKLFHQEETEWVDEILIVRSGSQIRVFKRA